jgi:hypothetical protein
MKGSVRAGVVITALTPDSYRDNAEERSLKVCASVADKNNCASPSTILSDIACLPAGMISAQRFKKINYNQSQMSSRNLPFSR